MLRLAAEREIFFCRFRRGHGLGGHGEVDRRFGGGTVSDELGLPVTDSGLVLPCGATGRWTREGRA